MSGQQPKPRGSDFRPQLGREARKLIEYSPARGSWSVATMTREAVRRGVEFLEATKSPPRRMRYVADLLLDIRNDDHLCPLEARQPLLVAIVALNRMAEKMENNAANMAEGERR